MDEIELFIRNALAEKAVEDRLSAEAVARIQPVMQQIRRLIDASGVIALQPDREALIQAISTQAGVLVAQQWGTPELQELYVDLTPYIRDQLQFGRDMVASGGGTLTNPGAAVVTAPQAMSEALIGGRAFDQQVTLGIPAVAADQVERFIRAGTGLDAGEVLETYENAVVRKVGNSIEATIRSGTHSVGSIAQTAIYAIETDPGWLNGQLRWTAILDSQVCPICVELDGNPYQLGVPGRFWDGQNKIDPHWNCRCYMVPRRWAVDAEERIAEGDEGEEAVSFRRNAETWVQQNPDTARDIFGQTIGSRLIGSWPDTEWGRRQQNQFGAPEKIGFDEAVKLWTNPTPDG